MHLINENHNYTGFAENMIPIHVSNKGRFMDALEEFEIYRASKIHKECLLNDQLSFKSNTLYDTILKINGELCNHSSRNVTVEQCALFSIVVC